MQIIEKVIEPVKTYEPSSKTKEKYECQNCSRIILSKTKRVYCSKHCQDHHRIKLSNQKWVQRSNVKKKPATWVNNALNMRSTKSDGSWLKKFKSTRG